jgi:hypothetical protein
VTEAELVARYAEVRKRLFGAKPLHKPEPQTSEHPARDKMTKLIGRAKNIHQPHKPFHFLLCEIDRPLLTKWKRIAIETCQTNGVNISELLSHSRSRHIVKVRHEVMYRLATETNMSLTDIGRRLKRDHTSCLHGARKHAERNSLRNPFPYQDRANGRSSKVVEPKPVLPKPDLEAWHSLGNTYQESLRGFL